MKAFSYLRVSSIGQIEGDGFTRQITTIEDYASKNGIELVHTFKDEGVSGTLENRPALAELMVALDENGHGVKTIIIERIDRLARDLMVQEAILSDLQSKGFEIISVHDGDLLSDDPTRKLVRQVLGAIAEYDKTMTVAKLRAARERKRAKNGKCEGRKGYSDDKGQGIVKEIKRLHRKNRGKKRLTSQQIADKMNEAGFLTITGKQFTSQIVRNILAKK